MARSPYARFFKAEMAPLAAPIREALATGPVAHELMPPLDQIASLETREAWPVENGYAICPDGSVRVFVKTPMPGVSPDMWDWWFAWHGSEAARYKLWHPRAHVWVGWEDGRSDLNHYVGRISHVVEYIGSTRLGLTIRFVPPTSLGFTTDGSASGHHQTFICARGGLAGTPVETGWLIHQVYAVPGGSEMRSRFYLGGQHVGARRQGNLFGETIAAIGRRFARLPPAQAPDLLVHCAQEMSHLAAILPDLFATFANQDLKRQ
jgi:hypothetical protein